MALSTLFACFLLVSPEAIHVDLGRYFGKDLTKLSIKASALLTSKFRAINKNSGDWLMATDPFWVKPYRIGRIESLYLGINPCRMTPGFTWFEAYTFDANWNLVKAYTVLNGYRQFFESQKLIEDPWIDQPLLKIHNQSAGPFVKAQNGSYKPLFHPESGTTTIYTFDEISATLMSIQDGAGNLIANSYTWDKPAIGPDISRRTKKDWLQDLKAADPVRNLGFLVWISGQHLSSSFVREKNVSREPVGESLAYEQLMSDQAVLDAVKKMAQSPNPWLKRQAEFALKQFAVRPMDKN